MDFIHVKELGIEILIVELDGKECWRLLVVIVMQID